MSIKTILGFLGVIKGEPKTLAELAEEEYVAEYSEYDARKSGVVTTSEQEVLTERDVSFLDELEAILSGDNESSDRFKDMTAYMLYGLTNVLSTSHTMIKHVKNLLDKYECPKDIESLRKIRSIAVADYVIHYDSPPIPTTEAYYSAVDSILEDYPTAPVRLLDLVRLCYTHHSHETTVVTPEEYSWVSEFRKSWFFRGGSKSITIREYVELFNEVMK